jgi:hypothetical protein
MRGDRDVIADGGVMADVIATPHHHVIADGDEGLNGVVLKDKAVIATGEARPGGRFRADLGNQRITEGLRCGIFFGACMVHFLETER